MCIFRDIFCVNEHSLCRIANFHIYSTDFCNFLPNEVYDSSADISLTSNEIFCRESVVWTSMTLLRGISKILSSLPKKWFLQRWISLISQLKIEVLRKLVQEFFFLLDKHVLICFCFLTQNCQGNHFSGRTRSMFSVLFETCR